LNLVDHINLMLKILTLAGLTAGLFFIALQLLIRKLERQ
jgi:hypothetical protein